MKKIIPYFIAAFLFHFFHPASAEDTKAAALSNPSAITFNKEDPASLKQAFGLYQKELPQRPADYEARLQAADVVYYWSHHLSDKAEKRRILSHGIAWAEEAVALKPNEAGGHLFLGILTGLRAEVSGIITGLKSKDVIKREMEKVIELDPNYSDGDAYLALGQWYALVPFFLGGSDAKAKENLSKAASISPHRTMPHLALAEFYSRKLQYNLAQQEIDIVLSLPEDKYAFESKRDKAKALELKRKIAGRLSSPVRGYQRSDDTASSISPTAP